MERKQLICYENKKRVAHKEDIVLNTQHCRLREMYFLLVSDNLLDHRFYLRHHTTTSRGPHSSSNPDRRNNSSIDSGYHLTRYVQTTKSSSIAYVL